MVGDYLICITITSELWHHSFMQTLAWPGMNASIVCNKNLSYAKNNWVKLRPHRSADTLSQWLSLWVIASIMQTLAWPGVNALDCLRQYFVICKEQPGRAQTSQVSWHFITCMCSFWQQNWINNCSCFMWIHLVLRLIANNDDKQNDMTTTAFSSLGLKQSISGIPGMAGSDKLIQSCQ